MNSTFDINGCGVCDSVNDCLNELEVHCGTDDVSSATDDWYQFRNNQSDGYCPKVKDKKKCIMVYHWFFVLMGLICCYCCGKNRVKILQKIKYRQFEDYRYTGCCDRCRSE